jgi:hypothetical protein
MRVGWWSVPWVEDPQDTTRPITPASQNHTAATRQISQAVATSCRIVSGALPAGDGFECARDGS